MKAMLLKDELLELCQTGPGPHVSLYASMNVGGRDATQNPVRVKNLLREAQRDLNGDAELLRPLEELLQNSPFWAHQDQGFVAFLGPEGLRHFKLPMPVPDQVTVGERYLLKPVLPLLVTGHRFYVLAVSQHKVRLLECTQGGHHELTLPQEVPENIEAVRRFEDATGVDDGQMTTHRVSRPAAGRGLSGSLHGQGITNDALHEYRLRFLREVASGVEGFLHGESTPLVLAGVDEVIHEFRGIFRYPNVLGEFLSGNYDTRPEADLQAKAWPIAEAHFRQREQAALAAYTPALVQQLASSDPEQVLTSAHDGRVGTLFLATDRTLWGRYSADERSLQRVAPELEGEDLLELAAFQVLTQSGEVLALPAHRLPEPESPIAAIFRY